MGVSSQHYLRTHLRSVCGCLFFLLVMSRRSPEHSLFLSEGCDSSFMQFYSTTNMDCRYVLMRVHEVCSIYPCLAYNYKKCKLISYYVQEPRKPIFDMRDIT